MLALCIVGCATLSTFRETYVEDLTPQEAYDQGYHDGYLNGCLTCQEMSEDEVDHELIFHGLWTRPNYLLIKTKTD